MIKLVEPSEQYIKSYIEASDEYDEHDVPYYGLADARKIDILEDFDRSRNERDLEPGRVGAHFFWLVDDEKDYFIGEIVIRHNLDEELERYGGHIGYGIRFFEWNKGYATLMLKLALEEAKKIGLSKILITCFDSNIASARVMEKNGFVLGDKIENAFNDGSTCITRRYWKTI
ncbi:MAG: GNAT family N-acetyltransferase [Clostridia bacterium]|nr:GNAT family N-acetyltransferase [Clostridia bacterium]